jgi:hypothetical protein
VGARRARRKLKPQFAFRFDCEPTGQQIEGRHRIQIFEGGPIELGHSNAHVSLRTLAQEFVMLENKKRLSCQAFAAGMLAVKEEEIVDNPFNKNIGLTHVQHGDFREAAFKALSKRDERRESRIFLDPFGKSLTRRRSSVVEDKAVEILQSCTYRTTSTYMHKVLLEPMMSGKTSFSGGRESLPAKEKMVKGKKKSFIPHRSVVSLKLNLARWARVYLYCKGFVEEYSAGNLLRHFIYEIYKIKSENELYVHIMKQSVAYKLKPRRAIIRRGHDGVWRIHEWPKAWP